MSKKRFGFTLVELMVGIGIMAVLGLAVYKFISAANRTSAIAECRGNLRLSASIAARQLERDVATSKAEIDEKDMQKDQQAKTTIKPGNPEGPEIVSMFVPKIEDENAPNDTEVTYFTTNTDKEKELYEEVKYTLSGNVLYRNGRRIADNIGSITFKTNSADNIETTYDGKTQITISAVAKPKGMNQEISHVQELIVSIRQLQVKRLKDRDKDNQNLYWKQRVDDNNY
jgi:prepilin-type N-terminal cleavage/methylation domain-containing protein